LATRRRPLHLIEWETTSVRRLTSPSPAAEERVHILSPFDPLIIQRKRLKSFFDYDHRFEAYMPKEKGCSAISPCSC
jgi:uncharacterized protein YcaQ